MSKRRTPLGKPVGRGPIRFGSRAAISVRYSLVLPQTVVGEADTRQLAAQVEIRGAIEVGKEQRAGNLRQAPPHALPATV